MRDYIVFTVGESRYAVTVDQIERISPIPQLTPVANGHFCVDGMMLYQDHAIKVVDFRKMIGIGNLESANNQEVSLQTKKLLIYQIQDGFFAIKVDAIEDIVQIDESMIKHYTDTVNVGEFMQTEGVIEYKKRLVILIKTLKPPQGELE